jgi:molecular chaperone HscA
LKVTAREESTGVMASIDVEPKHGLTDSQVETMLEESLIHAREDFEKSRKAGLKTEIGGMLLATTKSLAGVRDLLDQETCLDIDEAMEAANKALSSSDGKVLQAARDGLEQATGPLAALLMDRVARSALAGKRLDEV